MVRSYGFRLARSSISYYLRRNTSSLLCESSLQGCFRNYGTGLLNNSKVLNSNLGNVASVRGWLKIGFLKANFGVARSIHSTAHLSRDYYNLLKERNYLTPSEIKDACFEIATAEFDPDTFKNDPEAEKKFKEIEKIYEDLKANENLEIYVDIRPDDEAINTDVDFVRGWLNGGEDVKVTDGLSNMEAVREFAKKLALRTDLARDTCGGTGVLPGIRPEARMEPKAAAIDRGVAKEEEQGEGI